MHVSQPPLLDRPRQTIVFLHMPKTAGTTIHHLLTQHFTQDEICPERFDDIYKFSSNQLAAFKLFSLHSSFDNLRSIPKPRKIVSLFREPIERILSQYQHWQSHSLMFLRTHDFAARDAMSFAKAHDLMSFLRSSDPRFLPDIDNVMTRLMSHKTTNRDGEPWRSDEEMLDVALRNLEELDGVGIYEFLPESIDLLCQTFDVARPQAVAKFNVTRQNPLNDPITFDPIKPFVINDEAEDLLTYRNRLDTILYQAAKDRFLQTTKSGPRRILSEWHLSGRCVRHYARTVVHSDTGEGGYLLFGPYINLRKGAYRASIEMAIRDAVMGGYDDATVATIDVCSAFGSIIHAQRTVNVNDLKVGFYAQIEIDFTLEQTANELELRVLSLGLTALSVNMEINLHTV